MLTAAQVKELFLNQMTPADPYGRPMSDAAMQSLIAAAVATFERKWGLALTPRVVTLGDVDFVPPADLPFEVHDAIPHDPRDFDGERFVWLTLPTGPVQEILHVQLRLPGMTKPVSWPESWVQPNYSGKYIQIYPMGNNIGGPSFGMTGMTLTTLTASRTVPNAWRIAYRAGYTAADLAGKDADVFRAVGSLAALGMLVPGSIDRYLTLGVGGLSASVDGLSNSTQLMQNSGALKYAALIAAMTQALQSWEQVFRDRVRGPVIGFI